MIPALVRTGGLAVALALLALGLLARSTSAASSRAAWRASAPSVLADRLVEVPAKEAAAAPYARAGAGRPTAPPLLVAAGSGIFVGRVAGGGSIAWQQRGSLPATDFALGLAAPGSGPVAVYVGTEEGLYAARSPWGPYRRLAFPGREVHAIAVDPLDPATIWASSDKGPFESTDGGRRWRPESLGMDDPSTSWALAYWRRAGGTPMLLATDELGVYLRQGGRFERVSDQRAVVSLDHGAAGRLYLSSMGDGVSIARIAPVRRPALPTRSAAVAAPEPRLVFTKADAGLPSIDSGLVRGIHVDSVTAATGGAAYAGTMTQGLAVSYDGGRSWRRIWPALGGGGDVWRVLDVGGELVAATDTGILTRSTGDTAGATGGWWKVAVAAGIGGCLVLAIATVAAAYRSRRPRGPRQERRHVRVLVSGSTGLIGSALVRRMLADGHRVHRLVRGAPAAGEAAWDLAKAKVDSERLPGGTLGGLDAVVHLAGAPIAAGRWTSARRREILRSRVRTSEVLASAIAAAVPPPPVLVATSAVGYYGDRGDEELTEESPGGTGFLASVCREWERANSAAAASGVRVVTLRSGIVLDRSGGALAAQLRLFRLGLGGRIGPGTQWMSWITLRDEVELIMHAIATPSFEGVANAVAPNPVRNAAFTKALADAVHRPAFLAVPSPALRLIFGRDLAEELLLASQRVVPAHLLSSGFRFESETIDAALAAVLGTGAAHAGAAARGGG